MQVLIENINNQVIVTQPVTDIVEVITPGPQGPVGPIGPAGPTGSSAPFTKISGSDSWFTTSSIRLTGSLQGTASYALTTGFYYYNGNSSVSTNIDWAQGNVQELNLDNNPTLSFANGIQGQTYTLLLKQQLGGQSSVRWPSSVIWSGGITASFASLTNIVLDTSLNSGAGFSGGGNLIYTILPQPNGNFIVGGNITAYSGSTFNYLNRLNVSGSIDTTFNLGTGFNDQVRAAVTQSDGKILVGGFFTFYNGLIFFKILRLNTDGTRDTSFNTGIVNNSTNGFNGDVYSVIVQPDNKIITSGGFSAYSGSNVVGRIARLNVSGTLDTTLSSSFNNTVFQTALQSDGKIIAVGTFTSCLGSTVNRVVRLNTNGSIDTTFNMGTGFDNVTDTVTIQPDGKIIVGGRFSFYSGSAVNRLVRINTDGTRDTTFNIGTGFSGNVWSLALQADGKILVGGSSNFYNGTPITRLVRLNTSGSIDTTFNTGTGFNSDVFPVVIQSDGKVLVGGAFTNYNGTTANRIVRLQEITPLGYNNIAFTYNGTYYIGLV